MYGFVLNVYGYPRFQYSFPTRRSSDLTKLGLTSDGVMRTRGSTTPHRVDGRRNQQGGWGLVSTDDAHSRDRKSTRLNSSHANISYAVFCLKKKNNITYIK